MDVVKILNLLYTKFDDFCGIFEVYKIGRNQLPGGPAWGSLESVTPGLTICGSFRPLFV